MASTLPSPSATVAPDSTASAVQRACVTAVPGEYGRVPADACNSNYPYDPNFGGNVAFAAFFAITTVVHLIQAIAYKKRFSWVVIMGATWETLAFIFRAAGAHDQQQPTWQILGTLFLLLAPLWINAFVYMVVARLVYYVLPSQKVWGVRAALLTKLFVWLDVVTFLVQVTGGILMSNQEPDSQDIVRKGQQVYMIGISVQGALILVFGAMTARFYLVMKKEGRADRNLKRARILVWVTFAVLVLILVRIIYRLVEFGPGVSVDNPIISNETYSFVLDGLPMLTALLLLNAVHPGTVLRGAESEFPRPTRKERKAAKRQKKEMKRAEKERKKGGEARSPYIDQDSLERGTGDTRM